MKENCRRARITHHRANSLTRGPDNVNPREREREPFKFPRAILENWPLFNSPLYIYDARRAFGGDVDVVVFSKGEKRRNMLADVVYIIYPQVIFYCRSSKIIDGVKWKKIYERARAKPQLLLFIYIAGKKVYCIPRPQLRDLRVMLCFVNYIIYL